jgi:hypothetical protein
MTVRLIATLIAALIVAAPATAAPVPTITFAPQPTVGAVSSVDVYAAKLSAPVIIEIRSPAGTKSVLRPRRFGAGIWTARFRPTAVGTWTVRLRAAGRVRARSAVKVRPSAVKRPVPPASSFVPPGQAGCLPPSPANAQSREARGTSTTTEVWAFVEGGTFADASAAVLTNAVGREIKILWKLTGGTGDPIFTLIAPDGSRTAVAHGAPHGSSWERPGDEWGSAFLFGDTGCWQIHVERGAAVGDVWLLLR